MTGSAGARPRRLRSLDAFRGATIAAMILVNNPGTWAAIYPPFRHAEWHGWTPTDLIFPYFLFIVGVAVALALGRRLDAGADRTAILAKAGKRAVILVGLGLLMAAWPFVQWSPEWGLRDFSRLRFPGVLQRIGVCYFLAVMAYLWLKPRALAALGAFLLLGYWAVMALVPIPDGGGAGVLEPANATLAAWVDRFLMGDHLWSQANREWDPEGVLSTFPAVVTVLFGIWVGERLRKGGDATRWLVGWGVALVAGGWVWGLVFPINKQLWTSSYVLLTAGLAFVCLGILHRMVDVREGAARAARGTEGADAPAAAGVSSAGTTSGPRWVKALEVYGVNAITVYVGSGLLAKTLGLIRVPVGEGETAALSGVIYRGVFEPLGPAELSSLLHALVWVTGWWVVLWIMYRKGWVWKI